MSSYNWSDIKLKLKEALFALPHFFKNPVQGMRELPTWDWPTLLILQMAFALVCGELKNMIERDIIGFFTDIVISPIAAVALTGIIAGWFYYGIKFIFGREVSFHSLYTHVVFAGIPAQISYIVTKHFPPVNILGLAVSIFLLHVGFVHNFQLERKKLKKLFAGLIVLFAAWWAFQFVGSTVRRDTLRQKATPESLDILEKELSTDKEH